MRNRIFVMNNRHLFHWSTRPHDVPVICPSLWNSIGNPRKTLSIICTIIYYCAWLCSGFDRSIRPSTLTLAVRDSLKVSYLIVLYLTDFDLTNLHNPYISNSGKTMAPRNLTSSTRAATALTGLISSGSSCVAAVFSCQPFSFLSCVTGFCGETSADATLRCGIAFIKAT